MSAAISPERYSHEGIAKHSLANKNCCCPKKTAVWFSFFFYVAVWQTIK